MCTCFDRATVDAVCDGAYGLTVILLNTPHDHITFIIGHSTVGIEH